MKKALSGIILTLVILTSTLTLAFNIQPVSASETIFGTIYIRADGSVDPPSAPIQRIGDIYRFTDDIYTYGPIIVERGNIIIDGTGYTLQGIGSGRGFALQTVNNVTIKKINIKGFDHGIYMWASSYNIICENNIEGNTYGIAPWGHSIDNRIFKNNVTENDYGIELRGSSNNSIISNNITKSGWWGIGFHDSTGNSILENNVMNSDYGCGIWLNNSCSNSIFGNNVIANCMGINLLSSYNNVFRNNSIVNNEVNFDIGGFTVSEYINDVDESNTVNGKPIFYLVNGMGVKPSANVGCVILVNSTNIMVEGLNNCGVQLAYTTSSEIRNNFFNNSEGIELLYSSNNRIYGNIIQNTRASGISLSGSSNNSIYRNSLIKNIGIYFSLCNSFGNIIYENDIRENWLGIDISVWITNLHNPPKNKIFHNNFIHNTYQASVSEGARGYNLWDDGYPSGGNYWSDYGDKYPYAKELNGSGIWDTPYQISKYDYDNYPLVYPWNLTLPTPDFSMTAYPTSLTVQQGNSDTSLITITSVGGFDQPIHLTVSGAPPGVSATLSLEQVTPPPDGSATSTLTISVATTAPPGSYTLTVTGTSGALTHSTYIFLEITSAPPNKPPVGSFTYSPVSPVHSGDFVFFDASSSYDPDGTIISYRWNFGDGTTAEGKILSHRFRGAQNEPKTYTVTLTLEDNDGATDTETTPVTVEPLTKLVDVGSGYLGVSCWMSVTYNWVGTDEATGENLYIISKIETYSGRIFGTYQLFILRRISPPPSIPKLVWYIPLPTAPILRTYVTPFTPSVWQQLWGQPAEITTLTFQEGTFQGIGVTDTSPMLIVATGTETGILLYYDIGVTHFEPGSPITYLKPEELKELWEFKDILDLLNKIISIIGSPCELRIYDSEGRVTGLVNGEVKEEIPGSTYTNGTIMLLYPNATYRYEVVGIHSGTYRLLTISVENVDATTFNATDIPTSTGAKHQYTIDWATISQGKQGVIIQVDSNGDGVFERTFASDSELGQDEFVLAAIKFYTFWEDISYPVYISSNSTVSNFTFNQPVAEISFNLSGPSGVMGYCNVTIPKELMKGPWNFTFEGDVLGMEITEAENATYSFLSFNYMHASTFQIAIKGTWVIPEFPSTTILPLFVLVTLSVTILLKKKRNPKSSISTFSLL
jgi:parallel beta-helix repeat protein